MNNLDPSMLIKFKKMPNKMFNKMLIITGLLILKILNLNRAGSVIFQYNKIYKLKDNLVLTNNKSKIKIKIIKIVT